MLNLTWNPAFQYRHFGMVIMVSKYLTPRRIKTGTKCRYYYFFIVFTSGLPVPQRRRPTFNFSSNVWCFQFVQVELSVTRTSFWKTEVYVSHGHLTNSLRRIRFQFISWATSFLLQGYVCLAHTLCVLSEKHKKGVLNTCLSSFRLVHMKAADLSPLYKLNISHEKLCEAAPKGVLDVSAWLARIA